MRVGQIGAHGLGEQRVPVAEAAGLAVHEAGVHHPALGFGLGGERADLGGRERATGDGDRFGELPRRIGQRPQRRADQRPQARWRCRAARGQRAGALDREQRVAVGEGDDLIQKAVRERGDAAGHLGDLARLQRAELDLGDVESASGEVDQQRVGVGPRGPVAAGQHEQHRQVRQASTDVGA